MNSPRCNRSTILAAAVAAALGAITVFAPAGYAQYRVSGGQINDANNRVGSGGINSGSGASLPPGVLNNSIVTGNVTGGVGFQGNLPYFAPGAFHGTLPGSFVDNFVSGSTNVTTGGAIVDNAQSVHLYVGDKQGVNPPANFISLGSQPGYIPANTDTSTQYASDSRLGSAAALSPVSSLVPSSIFQTGGAQAGGASAYTSASPLFGVTTLQAQQQTSGTSQYGSAAQANSPLQTALGAGDRVDTSTDIKSAALNNNSALGSDNTLSGTSGLGTSGLGTPPGIASFATPRTGLPSGNNSTSGNGSNTNGASGAPNADGSDNSSLNANASNSLSNGPIGSASGGNGTGNGLNAGPNGALASGQSLNASVNGAVPSGYPLTAKVGGKTISGNLDTGEDSYTNIYSPTSNRPNSAYSRMLLRLKTINPGAQLSSQQRNLLNQAKLQDIKSAQQTNAPSRQKGLPGSNTPRGSSALGGPGSPLGGPGSPLGQPGEPGAPLPPGPALSAVPIPAGKDQPVAVNSFATDAGNAQTRDELAKAEELMKEGKFTSALEQYDQVEQQSPSNPFIQLGRANAELGASYYGLAEAHLRQAFMNDQALLSAQLDLHSFLGEDKLQYLVKDLKGIAQANPSESRPVFLLAYICYNTGNPRGAAAYLDLASKREGKPDPFFDLLRQHWDLPSSDSNVPADLNK